MINVLTALQKSTKFLEEKNIESPRMNAELLLADILKCNRLDLYLSFDRPLKDNEADLYREFIIRRSKFEPLQYITGMVEFLDLKLHLTKDVLIPRPETELLAEETINFAKSKNSQNILDVGTGSGNISIALAKHLNGVNITSIDISIAAIALAKQNAEYNEIKNSVNFEVADIFNYKPLQKFDLVISNPPYVSKENFSTLQKEIIDYEPAEAVTDNSDGLKFYRYIIENSDLLLKEKGYLIFEFAEGQSDQIKALMEKNNFNLIKIIKDYQNIERIVIGEKR
ncbi:MAG: peptide chain release factor N(5)-glutamine methyltransferase [Melioribacteraceae bacterium]|nr:peptide chain release factor N(5)-glutamine methyltransferase [Melioribacteraceae bacterium]